MENLLDRITLNPKVCHGKPTIRNMRYPVENMLELMASGMTIENLLADYPSLAACGVDALRLSPRSEGMRQVIGEFAAVRDGALPPLAVSGCNGYWHGRPGMLTVEGVGL